MQLSEKIGRALKARGATVTTAESWVPAAGLRKRSPILPAARRGFERGFVTYSNEAKSQMIGVSEASAARQRRGKRTGGGGDGDWSALQRGACGIMPSPLGGVAGPGWRQRRKAGRHGMVRRRQRERARGDAAGMLCRRPRSGASSGDGLCAKSALATISTKHFDTV